MLLSLMGKIAYAKDPSDALTLFKLIKWSSFQVLATFLILTGIITFTNDK
ncbi:MAG: hypothetical protein RLY40_1241 [Pseudomonadota bacterium]|jgi:hypothetical protein